MIQPGKLTLLLLIVFAIAVGSGWSVLYFVSYILLALLVFSYLWAWSSIYKLTLTRTSRGERVQVGEVFEEKCVLHNPTWLPKLWVQVEDDSTLHGHGVGAVVSLEGRRRHKWTARTACQRRGRYRLGPARVLGGDPLGLFHPRRQLAGEKSLLVLPRIIPLSSFTLPVGSLPGRGRRSVSAPSISTNAVSVRQYVVGDSTSHIHWASSARLNQLMVKEFDLDPTTDVWLILDLQSLVQGGEDLESTEEYGVTIAASLANYLLARGVSIGLLLNNRQRERLPMDRGQRQLMRLLETLACAQRSVAPPLAELLLAEGQRFGKGAIAIVITPSYQENWVQSLTRLQAFGVRPLVISLAADTFADGGPFPTRVLDLLSIAGIPARVVRLGDSLKKILES